MDNPAIFLWLWIIIAPTIAIALMTNVGGSVARRESE